MEETYPIGLRVFEHESDDGGKPLLDVGLATKLWDSFILGKISNYPGNDKQVKQDIADLFTRNDYAAVIEQASHLRLTEDLEGMDKNQLISADPLN